MKAKSFTDLIVWKKGHELLLEIYKITTRFPREELYNLTSQMRRAAVSITSNIAEGFVRQTLKEKAQFYYISMGSVTELQNQLLIAKDLQFMEKNDFQRLAHMTVEISKIITSLIKSLARV